MILVRALVSHDEFQDTKPKVTIIFAKVSSEHQSDSQPPNPGNFLAQENGSVYFTSNKTVLCFARLHQEFSDHVIKD